MLLAQSTRLDVQDIIAALGPNSEPGLIWNIMLYLIFFLALATMFMQSDKQLLTTVMMAAVAFAAVVDKLQILRNVRVLVERDFGTLLLHILIFTFPLIVAGLTRAHKSRPPAILTGILGGLLFFGFWFFEQRGG
jgi:hypothetical protein